MKEKEKSRLIGHIRVLVILASCGVILLVSGAVILVYKNGKSTNNEKPLNGFYNTSKTKTKENKISRLTVESAQITSLHLIRWTTSGFILISLGVLLFVLGLVMICRYWKKYQMLIEAERFPMLDPRYHEQMNKTYSDYTKKRKTTIGKLHPPDSPSNFEKFDSRSLIREKKKYWFRKKDSNVSDDSFRIAAHHHPSFNLVPIEGLAALSKDQSAPLEDAFEEEEEEKKSSESSNEEINSKSTRKFYNFMQTVFGNFDKTTMKEKEQSKEDPKGIDSSKRSKLKKSNLKKERPADGGKSEKQEDQTTH